MKNYPPFSWSYSRKRTFNRCLRCYYYNYYGYHQGWLEKANKITQYTYRLKKLTNVDLVLGNQIHQLITDSLLNNLKLTPKKVKEKLKDKINASYLSSVRIIKKGSERAKWWNSPKDYTLLREIYYQGMKPEHIKKKSENKIENCSNNIFISQTYQDLIKNKNKIIEIPKDFNSFKNNNIKIYAIPDLIYQNETKNPIIVDWKTGNFNLTENKEQLYIYAYYYQEKYQDNIPIIARIENLKEGKAYQEIIIPAKINKIKENITQSIKKMKKYITNFSTNQPVAKNKFTPTKHKSYCYICNFQYLCQELDQP